MKVTTLGRKEIEQVPWGVYLWQMDDGKFIGDDDGHFLMIASTKGNVEKLQSLKNAVKDFGIEEGHPVFFSGNRIVTDEEYEEQRLRMEFGLVPDPLDVAAIEEERRLSGKRR